MRTLEQIQKSYSDIIEESNKAAEGLEEQFKALGKELIEWTLHGTDEKCYEIVQLCKILYHASYEDDMCFSNDYAEWFGPEIFGKLNDERAVYMLILCSPSYEELKADAQEAVACL